MNQLGFSLNVLAIVFILNIGHSTHLKTDGNVIFIMIDDMRAFEFDPVAKTPNLDWLRNLSTNYNFAYSQEAMCNPSRSSILTGMRPDSTKIHNSLSDKLRQFNPDVITLPQTFKKNGYRTIGLGKIFHHKDPKSWTETSESRPNSTLLGSYFLESNKELYNQKGRGYPYEKANISDTVYIDGWNTYQACRAIEKYSQPNNKPYFLAIGFHKPHLPYTAPQKYWDLYNIEELKTAFENTPESSPVNAPKWTGVGLTELHNYAGTPYNYSELSRDSLIKYRHGYYACVSYIDAQIGKIMNTLKQNNLFDETTIVVMSDHGYKLGEYQSWSKLTNFEIDNKVPLLIKYPNQNTRIDNNNIVELIDVYPTLCSLYNLPTASTATGINLLESKKNLAICQFKQGIYYGYSFRTSGYRYTVWEDRTQSKIVAEELYDKQIDLYDRINVVYDKTYEEDLAKLRVTYDSIRGAEYTRDRNNGSLSIFNYYVSDNILNIELESTVLKLELVIYNLNGQILERKEYFNTRKVEVPINKKDNMLLAKVSVEETKEAFKFFVK